MCTHVGAHERACTCLKLYPTAIRGTGIGFSSIVGEVFNVVMPYIIYSSEHTKCTYVRT